ncbi:MAG: 3-hydroxyacyl-CoA dehydrogenase NAD-binding domain-containing protein, partial [Chloroflexi bacterium]|nr:3-hydroxyacyl-CoA dehydrogenase NAD-binding domain-containing protein [Chloroflexota bacterium]
MRKIGVVGAGLMGSEIAYVMASHLDAQVIVREVSEDIINRGRGIIERVANRAVQKGKATEEEKDTWLGRLSFTTALEDLARCEIVIEAVFENESHVSVVAVGDPLLHAVDDVIVTILL